MTQTRNSCVHAPRVFLSLGFLLCTHSPICQGLLVLTQPLKKSTSVCDNLKTEILAPTSYVFSYLCLFCRALDPLSVRDGSFWAQPLKTEHFSVRQSRIRNCYANVACFSDLHFLM